MTFLFLCQQQLLPHSPLPTVFCMCNFFCNSHYFSSILTQNIKSQLTVKPIPSSFCCFYSSLIISIIFFLKTHEVKLSHLHKTYKLLLHFSLIQDVEYYTTALTYSITHFAFSSFRFHDIIIRSFECPECFQINSPPFLLYRCAPLSFYHS